ncbi:MAG: ribonuclease III domain-containing protein, partial [Patescibacteria group bacterium]
MKDFAKLEEKIGIKFKNIDLLTQAAVHRSYLNENPGFKLPHNERLEFLGDAVLKLVSSEYLFQRFPEYQEGELTKIRAILIS